MARKAFNDALLRMESKGSALFKLWALMLALAGTLLLGSTQATAGSATWSIVPSPNTSASLNNSFYGMSCKGAKACEAVGYYTNSSGADQTLVERWNGTSWSIVSSPNSGTNLNNYLFGVSCTNAKACEAVGYYTNSSGIDQTLIERWNGTSWSIVSSPNMGGNDYLNAVSCTGGSACEGVGYYFTPPGSGIDQTLVERWNGTSWSIVFSPDVSASPPGGANSLFGVACTSTSACTAVGAYLNSSDVYQTLVERWNGTSWSIVASPNSGSAGNVLYGVSCTGTKACTAVGGSNLPNDLTLVETWNGTKWSIVTSSDALNGTNFLLRGDSCVSTSVCTAVGRYDNASGYQQTLIETG